MNVTYNNNQAISAYLELYSPPIPTISPPLKIFFPSILINPVFIFSYPFEFINFPNVYTYKYIYNFYII